MTRDHDFKQIVRQRMDETGQNYTAARADLLGSPTESVAESSPLGAVTRPPRNQSSRDETRTEPHIAEAAREHSRIVGRFFSDGRLNQIPMRRKMRAHVLLDLVARFRPGRRYPEREVNEILGAIHEDYAFWRRELVNYGYLEREAGSYRLPLHAPQRDPNQRQEIPAWEAIWLPGHLAGRPDAV